VGGGHSSVVRQARGGRGGDADAEAKTQLLGAVAPKKRSLVPVALGVVVLLGAGGAGWAIFGGGGAGGNGNTGRPDSSGAVAQNTDSGRRTQTLANRDTGARRNLGGGAVPTPIDSPAPRACQRDVHEVPA